MGPTVGPAGSSTQPGLGERLRQVRLRHGFSQHDLAGDSLSPSAVSLLESGRREPTARTLELLASRLGCTVEYLRDGVPLDARARERLRLLRAEVALLDGRVGEAHLLLTDPVQPAEPDGELERRRQILAALALEHDGAADQALAVLRRLDQEPDGGGPSLAVATALARVQLRQGKVTRADGTARAGAERAELLGLRGTSVHMTLLSLQLRAATAAHGAAGAVAVAHAVLSGGLPEGDAAPQYARASELAEERGWLADALWLAERAVSARTLRDDASVLATAPAAAAALLLRADARLDVGALTSALEQAARRAAALGATGPAGRCAVQLSRAALRMQGPGAASTAVGWARTAIRDLAAEPSPEPRAWAQLALASALRRLQETAPADRAQGTEEEHGGSGDVLTAALEATRLLGAVVEPAPEHAEGWREAAELLRQLGRPELALDAYSRALECVGLGGQP